MRCLRRHRALPSLPPGPRRNTPDSGQAPIGSRRDARSNDAAGLLETAETENRRKCRSRLMLSLALPIGREWPDWRQLDSESLRNRVEWPFESILFDVEHDDFWPDYWGDRPADMAESIRVARQQLARIPKVAPLFVHRCVPTVPHAAGNPVLSCYQTDVIYYGSDLINWFEREFHKPKKPLGPIDRRLPFWTALVEMDPDAWGTD